MEKDISSTSNDNHNIVTIEPMDIKLEEPEEVTNQFLFVDCSSEEPSLQFKTENDLKQKQDSSLSLTSLWKSGSRLSAFKPYKSTRGLASSIPTPSNVSAETQRPPSEPRPHSALTNVHRGNLQTDPPIENALSWFVLAGRGDITGNQLDVMISEGEDIDRVDENGLSALMWAAFYGQSYTVQLLLDRKVEVDREGATGQTALMLAATEGHLEIVRQLLTAGAYVNHIDFDLSTSLMCAAYGDHPHTVKELLINHADVWLKNRSGFCAYTIAEKQQSLRAMAVLENYIVDLFMES